MCSMYWNLTATFICPVPDCGAMNEDAELQTHWMGDVGSCMNRYALGEPVAELSGIGVATLGDPSKGHPDDLIGDCETCRTFIDFGARIENGAVMDVWPYRYSVPGGRVEVAADVPRPRG